MLLPTLGEVIDLVTQLFPRLTGPIFNLLINVHITFRHWGDCYVRCVDYVQGNTNKPSSEGFLCKYIRHFEIGSVNNPFVLKRFILFWLNKYLKRSKLIQRGGWFVRDRIGSRR